MGDHARRPLLPAISLLVFGSGLCALVYQMAWLRLLRLIFGSSTPATAAVLAIFMAGLGAGSLILGPRVDRKRSPLGYYAALELGIATSAAVSPFLILLVRWLYISAGGSQSMGTVAGTLVRILLATLVLGLPTFLMGGTLPAVARAVESAQDLGRRGLGVLYGSNTIGAVLGALLTTFFSIEVLGIRQTIWLACLINLLVAILARRLAIDLAADTDVPTDLAIRNGDAQHDSNRGAGRSGVVAPVVYLAAAMVGFAFFLMELVWYRMLAPLLGGSSYTFGLILAIALAGIGAGGLLYGAGSRQRRPTLLAFSVTCALEAMLLILPFAVGDHLAMTALILRDLGGLGFLGLLISWAAVVAIVVFPAAVVAGYQFPLLVGILGSGRERVGSEVGRTYAWNTVGAILGSLAGGFGLIPLLSATGTWRLVALVLVALSFFTAWLGIRGRRAWNVIVPIGCGALALGLAASTGPTAFWRHSPIGAGRVKVEISNANQYRDIVRRKNRVLLWEADGRESSIAMQSIDGAAFLISGKVDGNARNDASTQVMGGLIGAAMHPAPETALVIGLGTGSTAGWLAQAPGIERVDVVELEPDIVRVAEVCSPVNQGVLENPKVELIIGDGREFLLTSDERYDIVFSEPSNPYRAGIASLFTRDFYEAVSERLTEDGIFIQWLQTYEVDGQIVRTALATLAAVFPALEIWHTNPSDLMLLASHRPLVHDPKRLRDVLAQQPFRSAMNRVWGVEGVEGFYAGFIAADPLARNILERERRWINTDNRPIIEFGFARSVGTAGGVNLRQFMDLAHDRGVDRPPGIEADALDQTVIPDLLAARTASVGQLPFAPRRSDPPLLARIRARQAFVRGDLFSACEHWLDQPSLPETPVDTLILGECLAESGDEQALALARRLREYDREIEADAVSARWAWRNGRLAEATDHTVRALEAYRVEPWPHLGTMRRLLLLAARLAHESPESGRRLFASMRQPFAVYQLDEARRAALFDMARAVDFKDLCLDALAAYGDWWPWEERFLRQRLRCYEVNDSPAATAARRDLESFKETAPFALDTGL